MAKATRSSKKVKNTGLPMETPKFKKQDTTDALYQKIMKKAMKGKLQDVKKQAEQPEKPNTPAKKIPKDIQIKGVVGKKKRGAK